MDEKTPLNSPLCPPCSATDAVVPTASPPGGPSHPPAWPCRQRAGDLCHHLPAKCLSSAPKSQGRPRCPSRLERTMPRCRTRREKFLPSSKHQRSNPHPQHRLPQPSSASPSADACTQPPPAWGAAGAPTPQPGCGLTVQPPPDDAGLCHPSWVISAPQPGFHVPGGGHKPGVMPWGMRGPGPTA